MIQTDTRGTTNTTSIINDTNTSTDNNCCYFELDKEGNITYLWDFKKEKDKIIRDRIRKILR